MKILNRSHKESLIEVSIRQGLNRQIRRTLARIGLSVKSLKRTQIGKLSDKGLGVGRFRKLTGSEIKYLQKVTT